MNPMTTRTHQFVAQITGQLIVSCQALPGEPLFGAEMMRCMAVAAQMGGAAAIRANSPTDIQAIKTAVSLPIIGLYKANLPDYPVYITPTLDHARQIAAAGADVIAIDATDRPRPQPSLTQFISAIHRETGLPVLADIATAAEGIAAEAAGANLISTTLSGYTSSSPAQVDPDLDLVAALSPRLRVPLLAEGRFRRPEQVAEALRRGATAVVVGGAITRPQQITQWFVEAIAPPKQQKETNQ